MMLTLLIGGTVMANAQQDTTAQVAQEKPSKERKFHISDYLSIGGFVTGQYEYVHQDIGTDEYDESSTFQIRQARVDLKGNITPWLEFRLQADFANTPRLLDGFVRMKICRYVNVQVGQFKSPLTIENPYSPLNLEFASNAQVITALAGYKDVSGVSSFSGGREIGLQLYGTLAQYEWLDEHYPILEYKVGVFGGTGINVKKDNMAKDIAGSIAVHPLVRQLSPMGWDLTLLGSAYWGRYAMGNGSDGLRLRCSGGIEYTANHLTIRGEYVWGETDILDNDGDEDYIYRLTTHGAYLVAGYWFNFGWGSKSNVRQKLRPVLRCDFYQRDIEDFGSASIHYGAGIDWWPERHLQVRLHYTLRQALESGRIGHAVTTEVAVKF